MFCDGKLRHQRRLLPKRVCLHCFCPPFAIRLRQDVKIAEQSRQDETQFCVSEVLPDAVCWAVRKWIETLSIVIRE
jgi:hypothetical protein